MRGASKGYINPTHPIYGEYIFRREMAKLGYTSPIGELDCFRADCFAIINSEIIKEQEKADKRAAKQSKSSRSRGGRR